jgi:hypothetical protein
MGRSSSLPLFTSNYDTGLVKKGFIGGEVLSRGGANILQCHLQQNNDVT